MKKRFAFFRIEREERVPAALLLLILAALNALVIWKYYTLFTPLQHYYWPLFIRNFHISGFDPITYSVISDWSAGYNVYRHPLLAFFMYPFYLLNQGFMQLTGINGAIFVMPIVQLWCALYAFLALHRILRRVMGLPLFDATTLSFLLFSFAYVLLASLVPDHFILSLFLLLLTLYLAGLRIKAKQPLGAPLTALLFAVTAGVSLNNGLKVFLASLFTGGAKFFRWKHLLLAVILPAALMWTFSRWEYATFVWPVEMQRKEAKAQREVKEKQKAAALAKQHPAVADTARKCLPTKQTAVAAKQPKQGAPIANGEFLRWTDITTNRCRTVVENLFGEGIQLHQDHLFEDVLRSRPIFVPYRHPVNYIAEGLLLALFALGIVCGWRSKFLLLCLSFWGLDMLLHVGLGFGINEIYIMTPHWAYVVPISIACLLRTVHPRFRLAIRALVVLLTVYFWLWNGFLICNTLAFTR